GVQFRIGLVGRFLCQKVTAVERASAYIVRPIAPDRPYVVPSLQFPLPAPQREHWTSDAPRAAIRFIQREIKGRARAIILTHRVNRRGIVHAAKVIRERVWVKALARVAKVIIVRVRADHPFRQVIWLREKEPMPK